MKRHIIYECENCGMKSHSYDEIYKCEASHIGLTPNQMIEYEGLKEKARFKSSIVSRKNNNLTRGELDKVIDELIKFEERHNIHNWALQVKPITQ